MAIEFNASRGATLGVEWELQLIDAETKRLRQDAREVLAALPRLSRARTNPKIKHEMMESTVEVVTNVCDTVEEARADLAATVTELREAADRQGIMLACAGTHPLSGWRDAVMSPVERYADLMERMQWPMRRVQTFGVHVHVGVRSGAKAIPIVNALSMYLPHFLALSASSPYWTGFDTGLASSRAVIFGSLPLAGPPHLLAGWPEFEQYMDTLLRAETIHSIKEVWWDVRPHPDFGTVEIRMFDGVPTLREVGMVVALCQSLVELFDHQLDRGYTLPIPAAWVVRDNKWRATRYGLDAIVITDGGGSTAPLRDELYELVRELEPVADRLGCADDLLVLSDVLDQGAPYERQRAIVAEGGTLEDVVSAVVTELREDRFVKPREVAHAGA